METRTTIMNKQKILKLLYSPCWEDVVIGMYLLKEQNFKQIKKFLLPWYKRSALQNQITIKLNSTPPIPSYFMNTKGVYYYAFGVYDNSFSIKGYELRITPLWINVQFDIL